MLAWGGDGGADHPGAAPSGSPAPRLPPALAAGRRPVGVALGTIGVGPRWWLRGARLLEEVGYAAVWAWDHFISRGRAQDPVLEQWTILAAAAAVTERIGLGTLVTNVMNRHPAVVARMAATLQATSGGRFVLGIGIGGHPREHEAYGIAFPPPAARAAHLEEAVVVLRSLWEGGPVWRDGPLYPLRGAVAHPRPEPPPPIIVAGQGPAGVRRAARLGDGWTAPADRFPALRAQFEQEARAVGRDPSQLVRIVTLPGGRAGEDAIPITSPWRHDPDGELERWRAAGADLVVVTARTDADLAALVAMAERW